MKTFFSSRRADWSLDLLAAFVSRREIRKGGLFSNLLSGRCESQNIIGTGVWTIGCLRLPEGDSRIARQLTAGFALATA